MSALEIVRDGDTLRFRGALLRAHAAAAWARGRDGFGGGQPRRFDLGEVTAIDSAGLALLSLLATRSGGAEVVGDPPGFAELRGAYRLGHDLTFVRD